MRLFRFMPLAVVLSISFTLSAFCSDKITVFVSIAPQKYFVQQICKELVDVHVMVEPGASPATYEPKPRQMAALSEAKAYFAVGVPFERARLPKIEAAFKNMLVVHTDKGIDKMPMTAHQHHHDEEADHDHDGHNEEHEHHDHEHGKGFDPHIWLSPPLVKIQARNILDAVVEIDPKNEAFYKSNYMTFVRDIDALDKQLKNIFYQKKGLQFMVFHPSWGYLAKAYGLIQVPIEMEGKSPKPNQLKELISHAREKNIRIIFVQPQFSKKSADLIASEIGGQTVIADPLAENWKENLLHVADKFLNAAR